MKKSLIFLFAIFLLNGCQNDNSGNITKLNIGTPYLIAPEFLNEKIKTITETLYWAKDENGQIVKGEKVKPKQLDSITFSHSFIINFNESGVALDFSYQPEEGYPTGSWKTTVENNKVVRRDSYKDTVHTNYDILKYDEHGNLAELVLYRPMVDTLISRYVITNNEKGNYIKWDYYNSKNELAGKYTFIRDENERVIKGEFLNPKDSVINYGTAQYNDKLFLESQSGFYNGKPSPTWSYTYTYDKNNNWVTVVISRDGKPTLFAERVYIYY